MSRAQQGPTNEWAQCARALGMITHSHMDMDADMDMETDMDVEMDIYIYIYIYRSAGLSLRHVLSLGT